MEDKIYVIILFAIAASAFIYRAWRVLKANNIFMEHPSNNSADYLTAGPMAEPMGGSIKFIYGLAGSVLLSLIGVYNVIHASLQPENGMANENTNIMAPGFNCMLWASLILIAVFIHILINNIDQNKFPNYRYVFRVWFTTIFASSAILSVLLYFLKIPAQITIERTIQFYFVMAVFTNGFGSLVLCGLLFDVYHHHKKAVSNIRKKMNTLILAEGIFLAICALLAMLTKTEFNVKELLFVLPYLVVMGGSILYYGFDEPVLVAINNDTIVNN